MNVLFLGVFLGCGSQSETGEDSSVTAVDTEDSARPAATCTYVEDGWGEAGSVPISVEVVASGLATPWGLAWLDEETLLLTERDGRISTVRDSLVTPVAQVEVTATGEGSLLGLALHPSFETNRQFFVYATVDSPAGGIENQVQRWLLSEDRQQASFDAVIFDSIPALQYHNGGRIRIGPDDKLYVGTGDAGAPERSQDPMDSAGKLLRLELDGSIPSDNPIPNSPAFLLGIRNTQGFDWRTDGRILVTDHGPSGLPVEGGRRDHDEVTLAAPGDNLGWPSIYACESEDGLVTPSITYANAMPPGGAAIYRGSEIPEWEGSLLIGVMGFTSKTRHLHRLSVDEFGSATLHEVYLAEEYGRLREVIMGPDGGLYVTTSNCDGRGDCGEGDRILRVGR